MPIWSTQTPRAREQIWLLDKEKGVVGPIENADATYSGPAPSQLLDALEEALSGRACKRPWNLGAHNRQRQPGVCGQYEPGSPWRCQSSSFRWTWPSCVLSQRPSPGPTWFACRHAQWPWRQWRAWCRCWSSCASGCTEDSSMPGHGPACWPLNPGQHVWWHRQDCWGSTPSRWSSSCHLLRR